MQPRVWRRPRMIFVNSMSDLFHKDIPRAYIEAYSTHARSLNDPSEADRRLKGQKQQDAPEQRSLPPPRRRRSF
jgi:Protein of unknown function (DUF5131)